MKPDFAADHTIVLRAVELFLQVRFPRCRCMRFSITGMSADPERELSTLQINERVLARNTGLVQDPFEHKMLVVYLVAKESGKLQTPEWFNAFEREVYGRLDEVGDDLVEIMGNLSTNPNASPAFRLYLCRMGASIERRSAPLNDSPGPMESMSLLSLSAQLLGFGRESKKQEYIDQMRVLCQARHPDIRHLASTMCLFPVSQFLKPTFERKANECYCGRAVLGVDCRNCMYAAPR